MDLNDKVVVVTGVSKGIGYHSTLALLAKGARVYGLGNTNNNITHDSFSFISCNVRINSQVEGAFEKIREREDRIDILINNAGVGYFGYLEDTSLEQWSELYETNVNGLFYCCRQVLPGMKKMESGHIINIASTAALEGMAQVSAYCGTKWAVKGISESLFREVRDFRIKVTCIYPGSTKTDFFRNSPGISPHDYMLQPADLAGSIIQALETPDNFHVVNLEVRPLQPKGPRR